MENPCKGCVRPWKTPGCHDHCPDREEWVKEHERVRKAAREYTDLWSYTAKEILKNRRK